MSKVCVYSFSVSEDGFGAGLDQDLQYPIGVGGMALHQWIFATKTGRSMIGQSGGSEGIDDGRFKRGLEAPGSVVMGRNMFGPIRGPWGPSEWRGWWGEEPPFHHPVFVVTHFPRPDLVMGDTTFHFVPEGPIEALRLAREASGDDDVKVGGGVATLRHLLAARLIDEVRLAVVPITLGAGERLIEGAGAWPEGYEVRAEVVGEGVTHVELARR